MFLCCILVLIPPSQPHSALTKYMSSCPGRRPSSGSFLNLRRWFLPVVRCHPCLETVGASNIYCNSGRPWPYHIVLPQPWNLLVHLGPARHITACLQIIIQDTTMHLFHCVCKFSAPFAVSPYGDNEEWNQENAMDTQKFQSSLCSPVDLHS